MTAEIPKAARTHAGTAAVLRDLPAVRDATVDASEPYSSIRVTIDGVGIPPSVQRELTVAQLTIMDVETHADDAFDSVTEIVARNVYYKPPAYSDSTADAEPAAE